MKRLACAVYTRKSTEDGLEQEFNSLHAQREACEAYILSQRHEGWTLVDRAYDDGGFSGGNMERPGLKALMADVDAGLVDVIVVYKVDRLTRSLADFAKIVERLDARQASFVSVTQAFNTTSSMGRLTLNVLLSFAQFEREVTGERIRDKIAASKKKGMWMGGPVPLGYEVVERKLVPVPEEAERVRTIMQRYLEVGTVPALIEQLRRENIVTKVQVRTSGPHRGGIPFARGSLFHLLGNPVYRGKIVHKGVEYDGEHQAIVDAELWNRVQAQLAQKAPPRRWATNQPQEAMLRGMLTDTEGRPMVPTYGATRARRYAYYETRKDLARSGTPPPLRVQRGLLEKHLVSHLCNLLNDEHAVRRLTGVVDAAQLQHTLAAAQELANTLGELATAEKALRSLLASVSFSQDHIAVQMRAHALAIDGEGHIAWSIPRPTRRPFREAKLRMDQASSMSASNRTLVDLLAQAAEVQKLVLASPGMSMNQLGQQERRCRTQLTRLFRLSWLSPRIVTAITNGTQPVTITRKALLLTDLPVDWSAQERLLGFDTPTAG